MLDPNTIIESVYGDKLYFGYKKTIKGKELLSSPSPIVLYLGTWRMTDQNGNKKRFICGINLAYLDDENELTALRKELPEILKANNAKSRYRIGSLLLPDIFEKAYRTYNVNNIIGRPIHGKLYSLKITPKDIENARKIAHKDGKEWDELNNQLKNQYLDKAIQRNNDNKEEDRRIEPDLEKALQEPPPNINAEKQHEKDFEPLKLGPEYDEITNNLQVDKEPPEEPPEEEEEPITPLKQPLLPTELTSPQKVKIKKAGEMMEPTVLDYEREKTNRFNK